MRLQIGSALGVMMMAATASAQPGVPGVTVAAQDCRVTVQQAPPDSSGGWTTRFWRSSPTGDVALGGLVLSSPYTVTATLPSGLYTVWAIWTHGTTTQASGMAPVSCAATAMVTEIPWRVVAPPPPPPPAPPPPSSPTIWGTVDPATLGTCSAAVHDAYVLGGGDGVLYRTWHPQRDPSGCTFAHEHGDDPRASTNAEIAARPVLFGYIGKRMVMPGMPPHDEAHEGFKVFVSNVGDVNNEGRVNRVYSRSVFHMGTGGPKRFSTQFHSADIALIHPEFKLRAFTRLMMDTGLETHTVCPPRANAPTKDVMNLASPCLLDSTYEIWGTTQTVKDGNGRVAYQSFATPAVFDPVTVYNPTNSTEVVYAWDPRVENIMRFKGTDRSGYRGCSRESYAQPGYWHNAGGAPIYYTDTMGNPLPSTDPNALVQEVSTVESVGAPATNDGLVQFKLRKWYCAAGLGLKN